MKFTLDDLMEMLTIYDLRTDCLADNDRRELDKCPSFKKRYAGGCCIVCCRFFCS